ncbi:DNA-binding transcriptional regulator CsiR [Marinobacterium jannaschii]|uniref:DNA-binding transcriptional regulator CsiR n=1 Tax=Marinobacterium jannaschii TaxID=64970 RepID=UPI000684CD53|nr:DNA-binding transcriptional regulator CsiR [Marinobacterium jannaschii]
MPSTATAAPGSDNSAGLVLGQLKDDILTGFFSPGEKLKMTTLKARYQVGVSPLREALSQLLVEQLVVVENQRGFKVHPISQAEMQDIYQTRSHIEALCVVQAIENGDDAWEAGIVAAAHQLKKSASLLEQSEADLHRWEALHQAFHTAIARGCQSPSLLHVRRSLYEKASRYRNLWLKQNMIDGVVFDANQKDHNDLVDAVLARDSDTAERLIKEHLLAPYRALKNFVY